MLADLAVIDVVTGKARRIARRVHLNEYRLSPDGRHAAFTAVSGRTAPGATSSTWDLKLVALDSGATRLLASGFQQEFGTAFSWSPDGRHLAYVSESEDPKARTTNGCYVVAIDGGTPRHLQSADAPLFSADTLGPAWDTSSSHVYMTADDRVWRGDLAAGTLAPVGEKESKRLAEIIRSSDGGRIWSPDGASLYVASTDRRTRQNGFSRIDTSSGAAMTVLESTESQGRGFQGPVVSPDGRLVVYLAESMQRSADLWVAGPGFREPRRLSRLNPQLERYTFLRKAAPSPEAGPCSCLQGLDNPTEQPVGSPRFEMKPTATRSIVGALAVSVSLRLRFLLLGLLIIGPGGSAI